jgi:hypothetical protein
MAAGHQPAWRVAESAGLGIGSARKIARFENAERARLFAHLGR